jgi:hypothetical protein
MKLSEACLRLNANRQTVYRWRKKLGIVEETSDNVSQTHFKELEKLNRLRLKSFNRMSDRQIDELSDSVIPISIDKFIKIREEDKIELSNLKEQYNNNIKKIEFLELKTADQMYNNEIPEKFLLDFIEKYQKANITIINAIERLSPEQNEMAEMIKEKLSKYGS